MKNPVLYTSDIHGNEIQYLKLVNYAIKIKANTIIVGGDIAPKRFLYGGYIKGQREFLEDKLPKFLHLLKERLRDSQLFLMMGNDDCSANLDVLEKESQGLYKLIHNKRRRLTEKFDIVGYSYVPITPFGIKDWEKFDLSKVPQRFQKEYNYMKKKDYWFSGSKSMQFEWKQFEFTPEMEKEDSIQNDLSSLLFQKKANKTVYVIHASPYNTNLDKILRKHEITSVGSIAIRLFIERCQPYLTLHGHIHETVDLSGNFKDKIGKTPCLSSGNHDIGNFLAVLVFDLYNIQDVKRIIL